MTPTPTKTRTRSSSSLATAFLAACAVVASTAVPTRAADPVQPGKAAPAFTATDTSGTLHKLSQYLGKIVVLEWTNHECPYVGKHYSTGTMQKLQQDARAKGIVWLSVISSASGQQGHVTGTQADALTASRNASPTAVLLDPGGKLGHLYGATTTPHMFVISAKGTVAYMGGIDDKPSSSPATVKTARPFVRQAIDALLAGQEPQIRSARPYGCSVKYGS
ncbi:MAG: redoxin domain-containing protein [Hyphomicrobiaceae bacterium]